jgi:oligopeptide/dipeptide ABC transporter ATP-binding protein
MSEITLEPVPDQRDSSAPVLEVENLEVTFATEEGAVQAVRGVDVQVFDNEVLGIVGESGSGKSVTMLAVMGLLPNTATVRGEARFRGIDLLEDRAAGARRLRGGKMAMIFQDPLTALNPVHRVGDQISEAVEVHHPDWSGRKASSRAVEMLELVGIPQPESRARQYPHEFSGGMRQRAMIAMAIANDPELLIADEPTTALDVTIQAQILEVLQEVQRVTGTAIVFITHDLGVIARLATRVQVMYAGRVAEIASYDAIFKSSRHPYTRGLLGSLPKLDVVERELLRPIPGAPPSMLNPPPACGFHPRCAMAQPNCASDTPELRLVGADGQVSACHYAEELGAVESPTELAHDIVAKAPAKDVLFVAALEAAEEKPKERFHPLAAVALVLGLLASVGSLFTLDLDPWLRGLIVMLTGIPAVIASNKALRDIGAVFKIGDTKVPRYGRAPAKLGGSLAWLALSIFGFYVILWTAAQTLPTAKP